MAEPLARPAPVREGSHPGAAAAADASFRLPAKGRPRPNLVDGRIPGLRPIRNVRGVARERALVAGTSRRGPLTERASR